MSQEVLCLYLLSTLQDVHQKVLKISAHPDAHFTQSLDRVQALMRQKHTPVSLGLASLLDRE